VIDRRRGIGEIGRTIGLPRKQPVDLIGEIVIQRWLAATA
jgi:hypothetical protein